MSTKMHIIDMLVSAFLWQTRVHFLADQNLYFAAVHLCSSVNEVDNVCYFIKSLQGAMLFVIPKRLVNKLCRFYEMPVWAAYKLRDVRPFGTEKGSLTGSRFSAVKAVYRLIGHHYAKDIKDGRSDSSVCSVSCSSSVCLLHASGFFLFHTDPEELSCRV